MAFSSTVAIKNENIIVGAFSDKGVRKENQDSFLADLEMENPTFLVADGAGGYSYGKIASNVCVVAFKKEIEKIKERNIDKYKLIILKKYQQVNKHLYDQISLKNIKMMSTLTVATVIKDKLVVSNVGDTILFRIREKNVTKLSEIHSLAWEEYQQKKITYEEYLNHPRKNVITRAIGGREDVIPFIKEYDIEKNDIYIICTDGLYNYVKEIELPKYFGKKVYTEDGLNKISEKLIKEAITRKSNDNCTILIFQVLSKGE